MVNTWAFGFLLAGAAVHLLFALLESLPPRQPAILGSVLKQRNRSREGQAPLLERYDDRAFVSTILKNVAAYNLIVAVGFLWAAYPGFFGKLVNTEAGILFGAGAFVAGLVGLSISPKTSLQAFVGAVCLGLCAYLR